MDYEVNVALGCLDCEALKHQGAYTARPHFRLTCTGPGGTAGSTQYHCMSCNSSLLYEPDSIHGCWSGLQH